MHANLDGAARGHGRDLVGGEERAAVEDGPGFAVGAEPVDDHIADGAEPVVAQDGLDMAHHAFVAVVEGDDHGFPGQPAPSARGAPDVVGQDCLVSGGGEVVHLSPELLDGNLPHGVGLVGGQDIVVHQHGDVARPALAGTLETMGRDENCGDGEQEQEGAEDSFHGW